MRAEVQLQFKPSEAFDRYRDLWLRINPGFSSEIAPRRVTVDFQLFDDEWRRINVVRLVKPPELRDPIAGF
jgi:hypothetical protein